MPALTYHAGQLAIQGEAKTVHVAERLANWIGPVVEFSRQADLLLFAISIADDSLAFFALSGRAPLVEVVDKPIAALRHQPGSAETEVDLRLRFHSELAPHISSPTQCGGLAINFANARRARINGLLQPTIDGVELHTSETFTLCRKYIAPSIAQSSAPAYGPLSREQIALNDPWLRQMVAQSETMFIATISPEGGPDVAHRGGPVGFLQLDPTTNQLTWSEFVGDGVFKSAGNIRATGVITILIPDFATGEGVELVGVASYRNVRSGRQQRTDALEQHREDFPLQGVITCEINRAMRVRQLMAPRQSNIQDHKITSTAAVNVQAPQ